MANWEHVRRKFVSIERPDINTVIAEYECGHISKSLNPIMRHELDIYGDCYQCAEKRYLDALKAGK